MNFQDIPPVDNDKHLLDVAFGAGREKAQKVRLKRQKKRSAPLTEARLLEVERIRALSILEKRLMKLTESFPHVSQLPPFYQALMRCFLDVQEFKKTLGAAAWCARRIAAFRQQYERKARGARSVQEARTHRTECYGRISSAVKQIGPELIALERSRRVLRSFPDVQEMFTACIAGFPNVGKSTLLAKLSGARPKIAAYAFTTTTLNLGYITDGYPQVQLIDTPGTLNRFEKMNDVEKQAHLAMEHLAQCMVFVLDLTEPYPLAQQMELLERVRALGKPVLLYLSKADLLQPAVLQAALSRHACLTSADELRRALLEQRKLFKANAA